MGRGRSKAGKGGGGGKAVTTITSQGGQAIDLSDSPLVYGEKDPALNDAQRKALEAQEAKRSKNLIEYGFTVDTNGNPVGKEMKGGKNGTHIGFVQLMTKDGVFTHNHPRGKGEEGALGGTFSFTDLNTFSKSKLKTIRASAAEGTYSMTKQAGFDATKFVNYQSQISKAASKAHKARTKALSDQILAKKITYDDYFKQATKSFNQMLVEIHNGILAGQQTYGYSYTLEGK